MAFFRAILVSALFAGILAGAVLTGLQAAKVYPLIRAAEQFEENGKTASTHDHSSHDHGGKSGPWLSGADAERLVYSLISNVLLGVALGLILAAIFSLRDINDWRRGLLWGLGGFVAVNLAPALGLPPELPGLPAGPLLARQTWWAAVALCSAGGLALLFLGANMAWRIAGVFLLALPQFFTAPRPGSPDSAVPAGLAVEFAVTSLATSLVFWAVLGALAAAALGRQNPDDGG